MKTNMVLFEGTVMDAWESNTTDPSSEVIDLNYPVKPCNVYDITYNEQTEEVEETLNCINDKGWVQISLPVYNGLKPGDRIRIIKL